MCDKIKFVYGTAGYRANAKLMDDVVLRAAYYSGLRARELNKTVGLMLTASHNPPEDNGVKVIDFNGGMLPIECEASLDALVNGDDAPVLAPVHGVGLGAQVIVGTDTRESATHLLGRALSGIQLANVPSIVFYSHTTPQLHFLVRTWNDPTFDSPLVYVTRFRDAFLNFLKFLPENSATNKTVYVDCANGVGACWVTKYLFENCDLRLRNGDFQSSEKLNVMCGADYVKIASEMPKDFEDVEAGARCASLDGDADRLVYFYRSVSTGQLTLMDGDHISALFSLFISQQLKALSQLKDVVYSNFNFGIVQTAYSNGNSMRFFREKLGINPVITKTGVKYLEAAAHSFDIGVYFEANGHGTICFSQQYLQFINGFKDNIESADVPKCIKLLYFFSRMINEVVGDGIADLMGVEALLRYYGWTIEDWRGNTYDSLPNAQRKIPVKNRSVFQTSEHSETILLSPSGLQDTIDSIVGKYSNARAFVRPSGTESIVRIFAEASTSEDATRLAEEIEQTLLLVVC